MSDTKDLPADEPCCLYVKLTHPCPTQSVRNGVVFFELASAPGHSIKYEEREVMVHRTYAQLTGIEDARERVFNDFLRTEVNGQKLILKSRRIHNDEHRTFFCFDALYPGSTYDHIETHNGRVMFPVVAHEGHEHFLLIFPDADKAAACFEELKSSGYTIYHHEFHSLAYPEHKFPLYLQVLPFLSFFNPRFSPAAFLDKERKESKVLELAIDRGFYRPKGANQAELAQEAQKKFQIRCGSDSKGYRFKREILDPAQEKALELGLFFNKFIEDNPVLKQITKPT